MTKDTKEFGVRLFVTQYADAVTASAAAWEKVNSTSYSPDALLVAKMVDEHREELWRQMVRLAKSQVDARPMAS